ncbi:MAG TPA: response regulator [Rhodocyclaceae bacterium]|nr:response regulator [Rhodocyclaceae bacterium]
MTTTSLLMFGVDDDAMSRTMLKSMFGGEYDIELFDSAEGCLTRLEQAQPDILLLDVGLPGMDGFELCRRIKDDSATAQIPVIFISGDENLETRLLGYDSGGEDFILKPYAVEEVKRRVEVVHAALDKSAALRSQISDSEQLSSLLLSNMDEYAILIKFMRTLNECGDEQEIAEALLTALAGFRLEGAVQLRLPGVEFTQSQYGRDRPLEQSVMNHVRGLDPIFQFKRRCVYNYEHVTLLVNNMPFEDPETCGRLRDHLAIAAEMANARLQALILARRNTRTRSGINEMLEDIRQTIDAYIERYNRARHEGAIMSQELLDELSVAFAHLGLSRELEEELEVITRAKTQSLIAIYDTGEEAVQVLDGLRERLEKMLH